MVSILGGEVLCALGQGTAKVEALRNKAPRIGTRDVKVSGETVTFPYYKIDEGSRLSDRGMVAEYLDRVVTALLKKTSYAPDALNSIGVFLGSSSIDYSLAFAIEQDIDPTYKARLATERVGGGCYADALMRRFGWEGPSLTYNTACTSSSNAVIDAAGMLESGLIDFALVLGLELYSPTTMEGFTVMQLLTPDRIRPFDACRNGIALGEAVSAVLLSRDDIAPSPWRYLGGKSNCETYSVTGANPSGEGIAQVMRGALKDARLCEDEVTAVKAHGTASALNDEAEMRGMEQVFETLPPYLSLKSAIGHTLGGCGSAELVLIMECVDAGFLPPSCHFDTLDDNFAAEPLREPLAVSSGRFMLNYFGFGGNNTSLIVEKVDS
jgi:3-oxoacyl-[acyl-carrier-protein] synthase-1